MVAHADSPDDDDEDGGGDQPPSGLTPRQERAIIALLNEPSIPKAAERAGVNERTLRRWMGDEKFDRAFRRARREAFSHAISLMQHYAQHAVGVLAKVMTDPTAPHSARVSASNSMLRNARESIELDDLAARVQALEKAAEQSESHKRSRFN